MVNKISALPLVAALVCLVAGYARAEDTSFFAGGAAGGGSSYSEGEGDDPPPEDEDDGVLEGPRKRRWDPPQSPGQSPQDFCDTQGTWTLCGQDHVGGHSEFTGCLAGYCISCRLASECIEDPRIWAWCDHSGPCMQ